MKKFFKNKFDTMILMIILTTVFIIIKHFLGFEDMVMIGICTLIALISEVMEKIDI